MCVALPGQVVAVENGVATVEFSSNTVRALSGLVDVKVGDWVLIHAGCIIQKVRSDEAQELDDIFAEVQRFGF